MADLTLADLTSQANGAFALSEDQKRRIAWQQLMALGFGIAGSRDWTGVGRAGLNAMQMGASEEERLQRDKMQAMQVQSAALQNANALRQYNEGNQFRSAVQGAQIPGRPAQPGMPEMGPPDMQGGMQPPVPPQAAQAPGIDFQKLLATGGPQAMQYQPQAEDQRQRAVMMGAPSLQGSPMMPPPNTPPPTMQRPPPVFPDAGKPGGLTPVQIQRAMADDASSLPPAGPGVPQGAMQPPSVSTYLWSQVQALNGDASYYQQNGMGAAAMKARDAATGLVEKIPGVQEARYEVKPGTGEAQLMILKKDGEQIWTGIMARPDVAKTHGDRMAEGNLDVAQQNSAETKRYHNVEAGQHAATLAETTRYHNIEAGNQTNTQTAGIRKEVNALQDVQNLRAAIPMLRSVQTAPDTRAGDLDFVYAVGKILDPTSVVREGEQIAVAQSTSLPQQVVGQINYVMGGGKLSPQTRAQFIAMAENRVNELKTAHDAATEPYRVQAKAQGLPLDQIFIQPPEMKKAEKAAAPEPPPKPGDVKEMNGQHYRYLGGNPKNPANWRIE